LKKHGVRRSGGAEPGVGIEFMSVTEAGQLLAEHDGVLFGHQLDVLQLAQVLAFLPPPHKT
jgi:hypothetical protein